MRNVRLVAFTLAACSDPSPCGWTSREPDPSPAERNILVVVLDDVGPDQIASFGAEGTVAPTPTIDCLCDHGVRFERAWAAPKCSPGRAALQTGRLADRTGIGNNVASDEALPDEEITLAEMLGPEGYATGVVGKWHLAGWHRDDSLTAPLVQGYDFFWGTPGNLQGGLQPEAPGEEDISFDSWWQSIDGDLVWTTSYATSTTTDDALEFVDRNGDGPWMLVVAYHSPHKPLHVPPAALITEPIPDDALVIEKYRAMLEATDTELGRLLRSIDRKVLANTTVVLTGDNGSSPAGVVASEDDFVKSTLYEGGVHVPLVFAGAGVASPGAASQALVHVVDLLPTIATWVDAAPPVDLDGVDISALVDDPDLPGPTNVRTRWGPFYEGGLDEAVRDEQYKLAIESGVERLHDLESDPDELTNLLDEPLSAETADAYERLLAALAAPTAEGRWGLE